MKNKILEPGLIRMYNYPLMSKEVRKMFSTLNLMKMKLILIKAILILGENLELSLYKKLWLLLNQ